MSTTSTARPAAIQANQRKSARVHGQSFLVSKGRASNTPARTNAETRATDQGNQATTDPAHGERAAAANEPTKNDIEVVPGEGTRAQAVQDLLRSGADRQTVADAGVGWLVVETNGVPAKLDLPLAYRDGDIAVYRIGGDHPASPHRNLLIAAHLVWLLALAGGAAGMAVSVWRRPRVQNSALTLS